MDSQNDASTNTSLVNDGKSEPQPRDDNKESDTNEMATVEEEKVLDEELLSGSKLYIVLLAVTIVAYLTTLDSSIVATAIPHITNQFHSLSDVGWYGSAYLLATCAFQPSTGKIYANYSLKYTYMSFLAVFELGSLICGVAQSSKMLIIGRAISGIGGSGMTNGALTILATVAAKEKQPMLVAFCMSIAMLGVVSGPLLGGVITEYSSWRWCFFINLPAGAVTVILLFFSHIPNKKNNNTETKSSFMSSLNRLDPMGFVLFAPTCVMLLLALEWGGTTNYAWNSATVIGLFCGAGGMLIVFLFWEYKRGDTAMIPLTMLRKRIVYCSCLTAGTFFGALQTFSYYMSIWFQTVQNASPSMGGVDYVPSIGSMIIASMITGVLISKIGRYTPFAVVGSAIASIGTGLLTTLVPSSTRATWIGYQILTGAGRGMTMQQPITAVQQVLPRSQVAVGTTLIVFSQYFGGALILAFAQTIFSNSLGPALKTWAPGVSKELVVGVGATAVRTVVTAEELPGVLRAYNQALIHTWYLATAFTVVGFFTSWGLGWESIKKKEADTEAQVKT